MPLRAPAAPVRARWRIPRRVGSTEAGPLAGEGGAVWSCRGEIGVAIAIMLASCAPAVEPTSRDASGISYGGSLIVDAPRLRSLDPLEATDVNSSSIAGEIFEGLVGYSHTDINEFVPLLAGGWSVSDDRRVWTFRLRPGVRFHDAPCFPDGRGRVVSAEDIRYSIERGLRNGGDTVSSSLRNLVEGAKEYVAGTASRVAGFEALDPETVRFTLIRPGNAFLHALASVAGWVVPREAVEHYEESFGRHPVGTGPFRLGSWTGEALTLVRNVHYWNRDAQGNPIPYLDRVVFRSPQSVQRDVQSFSDLFDGRLHVLYLTGEIDWIRFAPLVELMHERGIRSVSIPKWNTIYYGWNMARDNVWTRTPELRRAVAMAVNRPASADLIQPAAGLIPPGIPGCGSVGEPPARDLERARRVMASAGFPGGKGLPRLEIGSMGRTSFLERALLDPLREMEIRFDLKAEPWKQHWEGIEQGEFEFFRAGWIADYPDAENFFSVFYSRATVNQTGYASPEFDRIYERFGDLPAGDPQRAGMCSRLEAILRRDAPAVFLYHEKSFYLVHPGVRNIEPSLNPMERKHYEFVWLEPGAGA